MLTTTEAAIRQRVGALLEAGIIDSFVGYGGGRNPLRARPLVVRTPEDAAQLVWHRRCQGSLLPTLRNQSEGRVGVLLTGCDGRALIELINQHQIERERLYLLAVACPGMLDLTDAADELPESLQQVDEQADTVTLIDREGNTESVNTADVLGRSCRMCSVPMPPVYDELLGEPDLALRTPQADNDELAALMALPLAERFAFWQAHFERCTLCYACQKACPMCFCTTCTATLPKADPQRRARRQETVFAFHLLRFSHMLGRCVGCGECERVCSADIPLSLLARQVEQDSRELFGSTAGMALDTLPPLSCRVAAHDEAGHPAAEGRSA